MGFSFNNGARKFAFLETEVVKYYRTFASYFYSLLRLSFILMSHGELRTP